MRVNKISTLVLKSFIDSDSLKLRESGNQIVFELPWVWVNRVLLKKQLQLAQDTIFVCSSCNVLVFALISRLLHVKFSLL